MCYHSTDDKQKPCPNIDAIIPCLSVAVDTKITASYPDDETQLKQS
ncbi:MAG: hypothetical protein H0A75_07650 [Candidatus Methanofishera endochildressiae]|uniref:Uncharacterized protein n=1 Tax=Candidatus Methanofishera endochildressiae TaxID=2738884 RepID=A0A7Z0MPZ7_9GAMM|nr:hypothetical protein [Candidatus Methanofishera endochildressiae]